MQPRYLCSGIFTLILAFVPLVLPARASIITFESSGVFGPLLNGLDPLSLSGGEFTLNGSIDRNAAPISTTADSATYALPATLQVMLRGLVLTGNDATLTLTDPANGPDFMTFTFSVTQYGFTPDVGATLSLPPGTLTGTGLQDFSGDVFQPDSSFSYYLAGMSFDVTGTLGITGTASMRGAGVPEPGSIELLAGGLLAIGWKIKSRRKARSRAAPCARITIDPLSGNRR